MGAVEHEDAARPQERMLGPFGIEENVRKVHPPAGIGVTERDLECLAMKRGIHP